MSATAPDAISRHYNFTAAFVAYCKGTPLEEISQVLGIPEKLLKNRARQDSWQTVAGALPLVTHEFTKGTTPAIVPARQAELDAKMAVMTSNREANFSVACKLRDDLVEIVDRLRAGTLRLEKQWHNKGMIVREEVDPTIVDRVNLATYARTIADLTYAALGDKSACGGKEDVPAGTTAPAITIILPSAIAEPRHARGAENVPSGPSPVIDLTSDEALLKSSSDASLTAPLT